MSSISTVRRLAWGVSSVGIGQSALLVYLPWLVELTPASYAQWAQLFGAGMGCYLIGSILWPLLLPRLGHRAVLYTGLLGFGASILLLGVFCILWQQQHISQSLCMTGLLASRLGYGLFVSSLMPATQSWAGELSSAQERLAAFSAISLQLSIGRTVGPVITVISLWLHPLAPLILMSAWPIFVILLVRSVPDVTCHSPPEQAGVKALFTNLKPPWALSLVAIGTTAIASTLQFQASPVLAHILQTPPTTVSQTLALLLTVAALGSAFAHRMQLRYPPKSARQRMLLITATMFVSSGFMGVTVGMQAIWLFSAAVVALTVGLALLTPLYSSQLSLQNNHQSIAATQLSVLHILGHWLGLSVTGYLMDISLPILSIWMAALVIMMAIASGLAKVEDRRQKL